MNKFSAAITRAIQEASKSLSTYRHGCVIATKSGKIITSGNNTQKTYTKNHALRKLGGYDISRYSGCVLPSCHAEMGTLLRYALSSKTSHSGSSHRFKQRPRGCSGCSAIKC